VEIKRKQENVTAQHQPMEELNAKDQLKTKDLATLKLAQSTVNTEPGQHTVNVANLVEVVIKRKQDNVTAQHQPMEELLVKDQLKMKELATLMNVQLTVNGEVMEATVVAAKHVEEEANLDHDHATTLHQRMEVLNAVDLPHNLQHATHKLA